MLGKWRLAQHCFQVFVGGLPIDISEQELRVAFEKFGRLIVDWPSSENSSRERPGKSQLQQRMMS